MTRLGQRIPQRGYHQGQEALNWWVVRMCRAIVPTARSSQGLGFTVGGPQIS